MAQKNRMVSASFWLLASGRPCRGLAGRVQDAKRLPLIRERMAGSIFLTGEAAPDEPSNSLSSACLSAAYRC
jgi:hypothetical protein